MSVFRSLKSMFGAEAEYQLREQGYLLLATPETQTILAENVALQQSMGADIAVLNGERLARAASPGGIVARGCAKRARAGSDPPSLASLFRKAAQQRGVHDGGRH